MTSRRAALIAGLLEGVRTLPAQEVASDESFRQRWLTIDALASRAGRARVTREISLSEYSAVVKLLRQEERIIFQEAAIHTFRTELESNYWHRGLLKFPSRLELEVRLLEDGKAPAIRQ